jgi:hypothetical protein
VRPPTKWINSTGESGILQAQNRISEFLTPSLYLEVHLRHSI